MTDYFECHITFEQETPKEIIIPRWSYSRIDGDILLGKGIKSYMTSHMKSSKPIAEVKSEMDRVSSILEYEHNAKILRMKIEHVIFDTKTKPKVNT